MRIIDIALYIFILNLSLGLTNSLISIDECPSGSPYTSNCGLSMISERSSAPYPGNMSWVTQVEANIGEISSSAETISKGGQNIINVVLGWFNIIWHGFALLITVIVNLILMILIGTYLLLTMIGVPAIIAALIQIIMDFIYVLGFIQWIGGRGFKEYQ